MLPSQRSKSMRLEKKKICKNGKIMANPITRFLACNLLKDLFLKKKVNLYISS
jgi:hypothetical protein